MKKIGLLLLAFFCFAKFSFAQVNELQFRLVLSDGESGSVSFEKLTDNRGKDLKVSKEILLSNKDIDRIAIDKAYWGDYLLFIIFSTAGKDKLFSVTQKNIKRNIAVVMNDKVFCAPVIMEPNRKGSLDVVLPSSVIPEEIIKQLGFCPYIRRKIQNKNDENASVGYVKYAMERNRPDIAIDIVKQLNEFNPDSGSLKQLKVEYPTLNKAKE